MNPNNPNPDLRQIQHGTCACCEQYLSYTDVLNIDPILDDSLLCGSCKREKPTKPKIKMNSILTNELELNEKLIPKA
jgi:hypothetical protein